MNAESPPIEARRPARARRGWWLKQLHTWHWMSAAISLVGMLAFAVTGITLNHAASIGATPVVTSRAGNLPDPLARQLAAHRGADGALPAAVAIAVKHAVGLDPAGHPGEWSDGEVYVALPRPGGDAWVSVDRTSGAIKAEVTRRGWIAWLNDLHKGRNAGAAWGWFIDVFGGACVVFTLTGLVLLQLHARRRPSTWPIVAAGIAIPAAVILIAIH